MEARSGKHEWEVVSELATAMGYPMHYDSASEIMDEIAALVPTFAGVSFSILDDVGSVQWPCNDSAPQGTPIMHVEHFVRGSGRFVETPFVPTDERSSRAYPLLLTTGRVLSQYNVGSQTRRTRNVEWYDEDVLEMHASDAEERGIRSGDIVRLSSRAGETTLHAHISDRMSPGVVYTTFHFPVTGANVVTTEHSDWATNCPEYKVTAVQVRPADVRTPRPDEQVGSDPARELVRMANQITDQFRHHPRVVAVQDVAKHLETFWDPHMRRELLALVDAGAAGIDPVVAAAAARLRRTVPA
jgi:formate dehydrogenase major subunit